MQSLSEIVSLYFPDEKIVKSSQVNLTDSWNSTLSKSKYWYDSPLSMVETDLSFYFDRRQPYQTRTQSQSVVMSPILVGGLVLLLWLTVWNRTPQSFILVILAFTLGAFPSRVNNDINQGMSNIVIIKKK